MRAAQALVDHVIRIADAHFTEKGYGVTSMATVASRARIGQDTLYRRYPDKATLFRDVVRRRIDDMLREIGESDDERDPFEAAEIARRRRSGQDARTRVRETTANHHRRSGVISGTWHGRQGTLGVGLHRNLRENYRAGANDRKL